MPNKIQLLYLYIQLRNQILTPAFELDDQQLLYLIRKLPRIDLSVYQNHWLLIKHVNQSRSKCQQERLYDLACMVREKEVTIRTRTRVSK
jgi:hypothetical protein